MNVSEEMAPTLVAEGPPAVAEVDSMYIVRRLTPLECCRLQGFPDGWTENLGTDEPTEQEIARWFEVFEDWYRANGKNVGPSRSRIVKWLKDPRTDAAEYKAYGNSVAVPCVFFCARRHRVGGGTGGTRLREIHLNGYIDDAEWFGDEITPESLLEMLYPPGEARRTDLRIILNSYGGSCNAAVRMFDDFARLSRQRPHHCIRHGGFGGHGAGHGCRPAGDDARLPVDDPRPQRHGLGNERIWRRPSACSGRAKRASSTSTQGAAERRGPRSAP